MSGFRFWHHSRSAKHDSGEVINLLQQDADSGAWADVRKLVEELEPVEFAYSLNHLPLKDMFRVFRIIPQEYAGIVLTELDATHAAYVTRNIEDTKLAGLLDHINPDDAVDIINLLPRERIGSVVGHIRNKRHEIVSLLRHKGNTAGGIMTTRFIAISADSTVCDALAQVRMNKEAEYAHTLYVVDDGNLLVGSIRLRRLVASDSQSLVKKVMNQNIIAVPTYLDQEQVARLVSRYDLLAIPVVNNKKQLVGVITTDDIIDVIEEEASADIYKMVGVDEDVLISHSVLRMSGKRLPWIMTTLIGGIISAFTLRFFSESLSEVLALAFFVPIVMGLSGSIGVQSSTITIRGLATGKIHLSKVGRYILRQIGVGVVMGMTCGLVAGMIANLLQPDTILGLHFGTILGLSMALAVITSATTGTLMPLIMTKLGADPAIAANPFVTSLSDIIGIIIYLGIATQLLRII